MGNKIQKIYIHTSNVRLPAEYQEVEYIQGTGSGGTSGTYIDTGFKPNNNTRYVVEYEKADSRQAPIGCWNNPANYGLIIIDQYVHYATELQATSGLNATNTKLLADLNKNTFYLNEVLKNTFTADTFQMNINAWLFCWNRNGEQSNNYGNIKIWSAKIYDDGTLVRDFVPCYRKQDSVIGMYDIVNNVFYTNAGSGAFTKGADIPNTTEHLVRPTQSSQVLFDFGDWTNSQWTTFGTQGTITKTSSSVSFSNSGGFCQNTLADYTIDISRDFLFEFNASIPTTNASFHYVELGGVTNIGTNWQNPGKICYTAPNIGWQATNENIAGARDYFVRREGNVLTIGWDNTVKYTDNNCTLTGTYSISEQNYQSTLTIYTAKFTYL